MSNYTIEVTENVVNLDVLKDHDIIIEIKSSDNFITFETPSGYPISFTSGTLPVSRVGSGYLIDNLTSGNTIVRTFGDQSISGSKIFSGDIISSGNSSFRFQPTLLTPSYFPVLVSDPSTFSRQVYTRTSSQIKSDFGLDNVQNIALSGVNFVAGSGLVGGGNLSTSRSFDIGQGDGLTVSADSIAVDSTVVRSTSLDQSISGIKTFSSNSGVRFTVSSGDAIYSNKKDIIIKGNIGSINNKTITVTPVSSIYTDRIYYLPDAGADADFVMTAGGQVINGPKTFTNSIIFNSGTFNSLRVGANDVSVSGHTHTPSDITNFNSSVSGLLTPYQLALTNPVTGVGTSGYLTKWISNSGVGSGIIFDNGTNVGIGTITPPDKLNVIGNISAGTLSTTQGKFIAYGSSSQPNLVFEGFDATTGKARISTNSGANRQLKIENDGASNTLGVYVEGDVGIGTSTPSSQLHVIGSGVFSSGIIVGDSSTNSYIYGPINPSTNNIRFNNGGADRIDFNSSNLFYNGVSYFQNNNYILRAGETTSTASQKDSYQLVFQNALWDGTASQYATSNIRSIASTSQNLISRLAFSTHNSVNNTLVERMCVTSSGGYVGIGTTTPTAQLQVAGTGLFTSIDINNSAIVGSAALTVNGNIITQNNIIRGGTFSIYGDNNTRIYKPDVSTLGYTVSSSGYKHSFGYENLGTYMPWMVVGSGGVGIGTTAPQELLHVSGTISSSAGNLLRLNNSSATTNPSINFRIGGVGNYDSHFFISRNGTDVFGIDTNNRGVFLNSFSLFGNQSFLSYNNANAFIKLQNTTTNDLEISAVSGILFQSSQSTKMRMDQSGNFGIGTTTPSSQLHVIGTGIFSSGIGVGINTPLDLIHVSGSSANAQGIRIDNGDGQGGSIQADNGALYFKSPTATAFRVQAAKIRLGDGTSSTAIELTSNGSISQDGNGGGLTFSGTTAQFSNGMNVTNSGIFGSVGIGTTTPSGQLHVIGTGIFSSGVGIGTTTPTYDLDVRTNSTNALYVTQGGGARYLSFGPTGFINNTTLAVSKTGWSNFASLEVNTVTPGRRGLLIEQVSSQTANAIETRDIASNVLSYISSSGGAYFANNVGIGTTNPQYKLDVNGNVNIDGNLTFDSFTESVVTIGNSSTSQTISLTSGTVQTCTLTGNCTFTMPTATAGKSFNLFLNSGAGNYTATFTGVRWADSATPTATITANKVDIYSFISDGTYWYGSFSQNYG